MERSERIMNSVAMTIINPWIEPATSCSQVRGSVLGQDTSEPSLVLVKPRKDMNNVKCRCDMTEILLKAALNTIQSCSQVCNTMD